MTLTPRQIVAYSIFGERLDRMSQANDLITAYVGAQGDNKAVQKIINELG